MTIYMHAAPGTPEAAVIADIALRAADSEQFEIVPDRLIGVVVNGELTTYDLDTFADHPRRATGAVELSDPDSFIAYVNRYRDDDATTLWSNVDNGLITAVFDDHAKDRGNAGFGRHRATLHLQDTPDWQHWVGHSGELMSQADFAEHIEDGTNAIREPDAATMLELAQSFQANTSVAFKSGIRLQSGQTQLRYEETVDATAGAGGSITIPTMITLRMGVFVGGQTEYELHARFTYRINGGKVLLGYKLIRPDEARQLAFDDLAAVVSTGVGLGILAGTPRA